MLRSRSPQPSVPAWNRLYQSSTHTVHHRFAYSRPYLRASRLVNLSHWCHTASTTGQNALRRPLAHYCGRRGSDRSLRNYATSNVSYPETHQRSGSAPHPIVSPFPSTSHEDGQTTIRERLQQWQVLNGTPNATDDVLATFPLLRKDDSNPMTSWSPIANPQQYLEEEVEDDHTEEGEDEIGVAEDRAYHGASMNVNVRPGDLILCENGGKGAITLAIFTNKLGQNEYQCINRHGQWVQGYGRLVFEIAVRNFISPSLIKKIIPFLPVKTVSPEVENEIAGLYADVPRDVTAPLLEAMRAFEHAVDEVYRANSEALDNIWDKLAHPTRVRSLTVDNITKYLFADIEPQEHHYIAVLSALLSSGLKITYSNISYLSTKSVTIRPKQDMEGMYQVREWGRQYREHLSVLAQTNANTQSSKAPIGFNIITAFAEKARRCIAKSRRTRVPTYAGLGPYRPVDQSLESEDASEDSIGESFTSDQRKIIQVLEEQAVCRRLWREPQWKATVATIMSALGDYEAEVIRTADGAPFELETPRLDAAAQVLLQELGLLAPFGNRDAFYEPLSLPGTGVNPTIERMHVLAHQSSFEDLPDSLAHIRRDYKDLTVFCIDPEETVLVDDAISLEHAAHPSSGQWWINIHVANPTAFVDKNHVASKYASHLATKFRIPEGSYNMLPSELAVKASLRADQPCLTFSARVDAEGTIYEHRVEAGIVRNVVALTPTAAAQYFRKIPGIQLHSRLLEQAAKPRSRLAVGNRLPEMRASDNARKNPEDLSQQQVDCLLDIARIAQGLRRARDARSSIRADWVPGMVANAHAPKILLEQAFFDQRASTVQVQSTPSAIMRLPSQSQARYYKGDPGLRYECDVPNEWNYWVSRRSPIEGLDPLEEFMLAAQHIAGSWLSERQVPALYKTFDDPLREVREAYQRDTVTPFIAKDESIPFPLALTMNRLKPFTIFGTKPSPVHKVLGYSTLVRVTSPLRAYIDMVSHWQIQAALLAEAEASGAKVLIGAPSSPLLEEDLPFNLAQMEDTVRKIEARIAEMRSFIGTSQQAWQTALFRRGCMFGESGFPKTFRMRVDRYHDLTNLWIGQLIDHVTPARIDVSVPYDTSNGEVMNGDLWEVEFHKTLGYKLIMKPVRLIEKSQVDLSSVASRLNRK